MHVRSTTAEQDAYYARAAFYGLYLRQVCGYGSRAAAERVIDRYPRARPWLEKFLQYEPPRATPREENLSA